MSPLNVGTTDQLYNVVEKHTLIHILEAFHGSFFKSCLFDEEQFSSVDIATSAYIYLGIQRSIISSRHELKPPPCLALPAVDHYAKEHLHSNFVKTLGNINSRDSEI